MLDNETYQNLIAELEYATQKKADAVEAEKQAKDELLAFVNEELQSELAKKDEPFGVVTIGDVKYTVAKKVEWDQEKLEYLFNDISSSGDNAEDYMDIVYKVKEAAFKNWPSSIQNAFLPARTVQPGSISIKIMEETKNA
jgi:hypothetical protein